MIIVEWPKKLFLEEYHVTIWFDDPKSKSTYKLKKINKITNKYLNGVDVDDNVITLSVEIPFNYEVKKVL